MSTCWRVLPEVEFHNRPSRQSDGSLPNCTRHSRDGKRLFVAESSLDAVASLRHFATISTHREIVRQIGVASLGFDPHRLVPLCPRRSRRRSPHRHRQGRRLAPQQRHGQDRPTRRGTKTIPTFPRCSRDPSPASIFLRRSKNFRSLPRPSSATTCSTPIPEPWLSPAARIPSST